MKRSCLIVPLIGLLLFGAAYWRYAAKYDARITEQRRLDDFAKQDKLRRQQPAQLAAVLQAKEAAERRRREREAEEQLDAARKQERLAAEQLRAATIERTRRLRAQLERLRGETEALTSALAGLGGRRRSLERERDFLADYVTQAEGNRAEFFQLVEKLEAEERARAARPILATPAPNRSL